MADETPVVATETPEVDPILDSLTDQPAEAEEKPEETPAEPTDQEEAEPEEEKAEPETPPEAEPTDEEKRKEEARRRYEERKQYQAERRARVAEQTKTYVEEAADDTEQRLRAIEVQSYNQLIESNENTLIGEFDRVKANPDLQMFNPESDQFNQKLYDKAIRDFNAGYLSYDANGNMVEIKGSLYQHLTETAELLQGAVKAGQFQQVRDQRKMRVNADSKPAETPKEEKKDQILEVLTSD